MDHFLSSWTHVFSSFPTSLFMISFILMLLSFIFYFMCTGVWLVCTSVLHVHAVPTRAEECGRSPGIVTDSCEPPCGCWEEQSVLLTAEPLFQLNLFILSEGLIIGMKLAT